MHWAQTKRSRVRVVPRRTNPLLVPFWEEMIYREVTYAEIAQAIGVGVSTVWNWRKTRSINMVNLVDALELAGLKLIVVPLPRAKHRNRLVA